MAMLLIGQRKIISTLFYRNSYLKADSSVSHPLLLSMFSFSML